MTISEMASALVNRPACAIRRICAEWGTTVDAVATMLLATCEQGAGDEMWSLYSSVADAARTSDAECTCVKHVRLTLEEAK